MPMRASNDRDYDFGRNRPSAYGLAFAAAMTGLIVLAIVATSAVTGVVWHRAAYGSFDTGQFAGIGVLVAAFYVLPLVYLDELFPEKWLGRRRRRLRKVALGWTRAFAWLLVIGFLSKTSSDYSRGWLILFYLAGLFVLLVLEVALVLVVRKAHETGRLPPRRVALIGTADDIARFKARLERLPNTGLDVAATWSLPGEARDLTRKGDRDAMRLFLEHAVGEARALSVQDVVLLTDWSNHLVMDSAVQAFSMMPVSIHLDAEAIMRRFGEIRTERLGPVIVLELTGHPVTPAEAFVKRTFDLMVGSILLVVLAPLLLLIGLAVRLDSPGPALFHQRRLGYNQREFRILKFRSMTTQDDGDTIVQARKGDLRITRIGAYLRRWNLDELPQLINVVRGEMSIVGPRPHAVAHDRLFEKRIYAYPRRTNVKPGITGWAQVNGFRGETDTDDKMRARVEHDLYYIDNWSLGLDLYILVLTVISPRSYRNAG